MGPVRPVGPGVGPDAPDTPVPPERFGSLAGLVLPRGLELEGLG